MENQNKKQKTLKEKVHEIAFITLISSLFFVGITNCIYSTLGIVGEQTVKFKTRVVSYIMGDVVNYGYMVNVPKAKAVKKVYKYNEQVPKEIIKAEIIKQAKIYGNDEQFMLKLAFCESGYNNLAKNPNSTARGIYQYLIKTWNKTESAKNNISRYDFKANIKEANIDIANHEYFRWSECLDK